MILIVEDEKLNCFILKSFLEKHGYKTLIAENGAIALNVLMENQDISLVLLDLNMPVMNGYEFLQELSNNETYKNLKLEVIIISTVDKISFEMEKKHREINTGLIKAYLSKPIDLPKLLTLTS